MTNKIEGVVPRWYVREDTVAGPLYFYPMQAAPAYADLERLGQLGREPRWENDRGGPVEKHGGYLVTREPTASVTARWETQPPTSHYQLRDRETIASDSLLAAIWDSLPETLSPAEWGAKCSCDGLGGCHWCDTRYQLYQAVPGEPEEKSSTIDVSHFVEMPAAPEPAPERSWTLDSPQLAAIYPSRAAHLFPGHLTGVQYDVYAAVEKWMVDLALPDTTLHNFVHDRSILVRCSIPWDHPLPWNDKPARSKAARQAAYEQRRRATIGMTWHRSAKIPLRVSAPSKAEALAKLESLVADYLIELTPPHTRVCSTCRGLGYTE